MNGTIHGGWDFIVAAYVTTAAALGLYGVHLLRVLRRTERDDD